MARITVSSLGRDVEKLCNLDENRSKEAVARIEDPYHTHVVCTRWYAHATVYVRNRVCVHPLACVHYVRVIIIIIIITETTRCNDGGRTSSAEHDNYRASHNKLVCTRGPLYARIGVPLAMPARFRVRSLLHEPSRNFGTRRDLPDEMLNPETRTSYFYNRENVINYFE